MAIVGAGPHGLSVAAHLRHAKVPFVIFGEVMSFWQRHMPAGMLLRSERRGSHIADPEHRLTLDRYEAELGRTLPPRISLDDYIGYGQWFQQRAAPHVDLRRVARIERHDGQEFRLTLEDGDVERARRVVVATGLQGFAVRPGAFAGIPPELAPHSSQVREPAAYKGLDVAVIGAGQSALELATLLHEAGARVEVIARAPALRFTSGRGWLRNTVAHKLIYPPGEVGPPGINWVIELPPVFRSLPSEARRWVAGRVRPVGAFWLQPRMDGVRVTAGRSVAAATVVDDGARLRIQLDDGAERELDRAVLATGYRPRIDRSPILAPELARSIQREDGCAPQLRAAFESSVPGLHFIGAAAAASYGPLMLFVAGTRYAGQSVARHIVAASRT